MTENDESTRSYGMSWELIQQYDSIIIAIATKYTNDHALREDVIQEVKLRLHTDKRLDVNNFHPDKRDAAIRNTIRNKTLTILKSKKSGRWPFDSLDALRDMGVQIDSDNRILYPGSYLLGRPVDAEEGEDTLFK
jgi:hypothetical protein